MESSQKMDALADAIIRLFTEADIEAFHAHSYEKAKNYLTSEVEKRWEMTLNQTM